MIVYTLYPVAGKIPVGAELEARVPAKVVGSRKVDGRQILTIEISSIREASIYYDGVKVEAEA